MGRRYQDLESRPLAPNAGSLDTFDSDSDAGYDLPARSFKHPKLTWYHALFLALTASFGISKAALMLRLNTHSGLVAATSLDLGFGVCVLLLFWLGLYEESHPPWMDLLFTPTTEAPTPRKEKEEWHHPKLTGYRILVIGLTSLVGILKAVLTFKGQSAAPNVLDWLLGVVCVVCLYWLGWYEKSHPTWMHWLFNNKSQEPPWLRDHPKLTGYRIAVIAVTVSLGVSKAVSTSKGKSTEAVWLDLTLGVPWTMALFWLGLYQRRCPLYFRWLFIADYSSQFLKFAYISAWICGAICLALLFAAVVALFIMAYFVITGVVLYVYSKVLLGTVYLIVSLLNLLGKLMGL